MKRFKRVFQLFFVLAILFNCKSVFAMEKTFTVQDYEYTISKVYLNVYENFVGLNDESVKEIDISSSVNIKPQYIVFDDTNSNVDYKRLVTYINPGLDITKEKLLSILKDNVSLNDESNSYFVQMVVDYSISNTSKQNVVVISERIYDNGNYSSGSVNFGDSLSQVFSAFEYKLVDNQEYLNYTSSYNDESQIYVDYLYDAVGIVYSRDNGYGINVVSFVGFDNIEAFLKDLYQKNSSLFNMDLSSIDSLNNVVDRFVPVADEVVPIPNTFKGVPSIYVIGGVIALLIGSVVIYKTVKPQNS